MNTPSGNHTLDWVWSWISSRIQEELRSAIYVPSNEVNAVFRLGFEGRNLFLKVGPNLQREYERLQWLEGRLPCPRPVDFTTHRGTDAMLMSALEGDGLSRLSATLPPQIIIPRLVQALKGFHAISAADWPFGGKGTVLVHGDACLPNFLFRNDHLSGYIDIGDMTLGEPDVDLAAAVWSLQYNLGPGHGLAFLHAYGRMDADEADVERLRLQYEEG